MVSCYISDSSYLDHLDGGSDDFPKLGSYKA